MGMLLVSRRPTPKRTNKSHFTSRRAASILAYHAPPMFLSGSASYTPTPIHTFIALRAISPLLRPSSPRREIPRGLRAGGEPPVSISSFNRCEFKLRRRVVIMHGPDGASYSQRVNLCRDRRAEKVVVQHVSDPKFFFTITLTPTATDRLVGVADRRLPKSRTSTA